MRTEESEPGRPARRRRSDGERSRRAILDTAARLATVEGLDGITIGRLAEQTGMSKSGLFAHFGSKEELQLETIDVAAAVFDAEVLEPALAEPGAAERLRALAERFLHHVGADTFPGGCFFASVAAELDTRPGPVRDRAVAVVHARGETIRRTVAEAQEEGSLDASLDPAQVAFELQAYLLAGNADYLLCDCDPAALDRAGRAVEGLLGRVSVPARDVPRAG